MIKLTVYRSNNPNNVIECSLFTTALRCLEYHYSVSKDVSGFSIEFL